MVFPAFTPPVTMMLHRLLTAAARKAAVTWSRVPSLIRPGSVTSSCPCRRSETHGLGVTDIVAVIRAPPSSATLTSGDAAEKSRAVCPPLVAQVRIMLTSASSLAAMGAAATRSPVE